jgi:hypothetical protein
MKDSRVFRILALAIILSLLMLAIPATPALAQSITLSATSGPVGTIITVTGASFTPSTGGVVWFDSDGDSVIDSGEPQVPVTTTGVGAIPSGTTITIPSVVRNIYQVRADIPTGGAIEAWISFMVTPQITLSASSGYVGDTVTVSGTGFNAGSVTIYFDTTSRGTVTASASGAFSSFTFTIPESYRGNHGVKGTDASGDSPAVSFTTLQKITISPTSGAVGDTVTINGTGFGASSSVTFYFDDVSIGTTAATNSNGTFPNSTFAIPSTSRGSHTIKAQDASVNYATATFTVAHKITISPTSGAVGDTVTINGTGFATSSSVTFYFDDVSIGTATATDSNGSFANSTFAIPSTSRGSHTIKAQDASGNYATATFTVAHKMTITPTSGASGTSVTVSGTGFGASKTITIKYYNELVTTTPASITTDANGSFTASFMVPAGLAGTYAVQVSDGINTASANFVSTTDATISQTTSAAAPGYVGMELTITGKGFKPNAPVTVTYTTNPVTLATVTTDASGNFSVKITIPPSTGGSHTITVTDSYITKEFTFVMESTAPTIPQPLLPLMGNKAKSLAYFDWEDVDDPSKPVTYDLQIASDADFKIILVEKNGLTTSEYTLTEAEKLKSTKKEAPYCWRLRAIDAASNASGWSGTGTFYVGFTFPAIEGWVLYGLLGAVALLFFFLGLFVGRRKGGSGYY